MFENLYTTKMSTDKKKLQNRFSKIRSKNGRISKLMALIIFAVILLVMTCVSIIIAANIKSDEYTMTENEFSDYINRPIGAVMADINYADENKIVFHYAEGFFIDNLQTEEIDYAINLEKLDIAYNQQGSSVLEIKVDKGGKYAYLSTVGPADEINDYEKYIVNLENGEVKKGAMPENAELFTGIADTFTTVQNPIGWYSNNCIVSNDKIYYLTSEIGAVNGMQLITVNKADGEIEHKYIFGDNYVSVASQITEYTPDDIKDIADAELVVGGTKYPLAVTNAHTEIEKAFSTAEKIKMGGTACPFGAELIFTRKDGQKGYVTIATDSCAVFKSGDTYYDYGEDNSMLLGYFGLDENTVIDLTTITKSYMENSEIAVRNFFTAFDKSDLDKLKTLVTNEFIAQGYIGDYGMCYGMTRATLETCSKANVDEFLNEYLARSENAQLTLSENDIELLKANSDELAVYTVIVTAESNIKGETKPPFKSFLNVICKKQNNGSWLVHKLES
ncbi:MAG: hypothetical protein IKB93_07485 [Clostridia bacterium]|nr:hypothetical protein [Clostridia bacterium]